METLSGRAIMQTQARTEPTLSGTQAAPSYFRTHVLAQAAVAAVLKTGHIMSLKTARLAAKTAAVLVERPAFPTGQRELQTEDLARVAAIHSMLQVPVFRAEAGSY